MIDSKVDERSVMTYLAQYPNAKLRQDAPINKPMDSKRCRAYGPGLERATVGQPASFKVDTVGAGYGKLEVLIQSPNGSIEPVIECRIGN